MNKRRVVIMALTCVLLIASTANVFAYVTMRDGYYQKTVPLKFGRSVYPDEISKAMSSWNNASVGRSFTTSTSGNPIVIVNEATTSYGQYIPNKYHSAPHNNAATSFTINLNDKMMPKLNSRGKESVICHEMGHALGLYENNGSGALMDQTRTRSSIFAPQQDDINGARAQARANGWYR